MRARNTANLLRAQGREHEFHRMILLMGFTGFAADLFREMNQTAERSRNALADTLNDVEEQVDRVSADAVQERERQRAWSSWHEREAVRERERATSAGFQLIFWMLRWMCSIRSHRTNRFARIRCVWSSRRPPGSGS